MSYKLDAILTMLDEILMRLDRIERMVDFDDELGPDDTNTAFEKVFAKKVDKPRLTVVKSDTNNIVDFDKNE